MKQTGLFFILLLFSCHTLFAQTPNWTVKESDYQYTMTFVAKLNIGGKRLVNPNDKVAAFVGGTCRGISGVTYVESEKNYYAFLTVFSNQQGEAISFKLYDSAADKITSVSKQIAFAVNEHKGNLFQSYSIAEPALNHLSEILSFNFMNITSLSSIINSGSVKVNISESYPLTNLKPVFTLSKGANLFKNRVLQKSGEVTENFSSPITYEVLSEDESTLNSYTVNVSQSTNPTLFYKKDAVCYARGAIKVVSKQEGASVKVAINGKIVATKPITNGEALFLNLNAGSYIATLGNEWKLINIRLKEK
ncbi:MAG TPA: hypothetical protein VFM79_01710 [Pelobium sp.]|nr:hypothetical protein [Pelobium sp.]